MVLLTDRNSFTGKAKELLSSAVPELHHFFVSSSDRGVDVDEKGPCPALFAAKESFQRNSPHKLVAEGNARKRRN